MPDVPTTLDDMVSSLVGELDQVADQSTAAGLAKFDQWVPETRQLAAQVGLDLDDPAVAEVAVRIMFAISAVAHRTLDEDLAATWFSTVTSTIEQRMSAHVRWVAAGRLAAAADGTLTLPDLTPPDPAPSRRRWWRGGAP